ncbi:MAG: hypothetical protein JXB46_04745 [Candidatus Eisenbacteria bacterium]|nr:hypothetical protein [Candidatus Eisenbacteria bacterium]
MTAAFTLLALVGLTGVAGAFTLAEWERYGNMVPTYDARSLAMGGAGVASAEGARGLNLNPALLGKTEAIDVALNGMVVVAEEAREVPLHDSFDGIIAYNTYAFNAGVYDRYSAAVAFKAMTVTIEGAELGTGVGIGYYPTIDMSYNYHVQYRDPDSQAEPADKILYDYYLEGDGGVNAFTVGVGQEVVSGVYLGLGVDFLRGQYDVTKRWAYPPNSDQQDEDSKSEHNDVQGTRFALGLMAERFHRFDLAVVYRSSFELTGEYTNRPAGAEASSSSDFKYKYPDAMVLGVEYRPRNLLMTRVDLDVEYVNWSGFEDDTPGSNPKLDDTVTYRIGVEHGFFDNTMARFGFSYEPSYVDKRSSTAAFSIGLGMDVVGVRVDLAGQVGVREYEIDEGRVRETTTVAVATVTHTF